MAKEIIFLTFVQVCLKLTTTSTTVSQPPTTTPFITCTYNNGTYLPNTTFEAETCVTGYCDSNGEVALSISCCKYGEDTYPLYSSFKLSPCETLYCESDGQAQVTSQSCPELPCPNPVRDDNECCQRCPDGCVPGCEYNGTWYAANSEFKISPCETGYCDSDGQYTIMIADCAPVMCPNPIHDEDECCDRCPDGWVPGCDYNGQRYEIGTDFTVDVCTSGYCDENYEVTLSMPSCEIPECPVTKYLPDRCCPVCDDSGCEYNGTWYTANSEIQISPCEIKYCGSDGQISDIVVDCPVLMCPNHIHNESECCDRCPDGWVPGCDYNGQRYEVSSEIIISPCEKGFCGSAGQFSLEVEDCPELMCEYPIHNESECCDRCPDGWVPGCDYNGQWHEVNKEFKISPCVTAYCDSDGKISQGLNQDCPELMCPNPIRDEDECCERCPDGWVPGCDYNGQWHEIGTDFNVDACTSGYCDEYSEVILSMPSCEIPNCPNVIYPPDRCCPVCDYIIPEPPPTPEYMP